MAPPLLVLLCWGCGDGASAPADGPDRSQRLPPPAGRGASLELADELHVAQQLVAQGRTPAARSRIFQYLKRSGGAARADQAQALLGTCFLLERRYEPAREHFESALAIRPDHHPARKSLGYCAYYLGDLARARAHLEQYLAAMPDDGEAHGALGVVLLEQDDLTAAGRCLARSLELAAAARRGGRGAGPEARALSRLADLCVARGELEEGRARYEQSLALVDDDEVRYRLHRVYLQLGDDDAADLVLAKIASESLAGAGDPAAHR